MSQNILLIALRRGTRFGFVKASANKRSETIKDAMAGGRIHSGEGREFMGVVGDWLREDAVLHTTTGAYDPNANSLKRVLVLGNVVCRCLLHQANASVCLWPDAAEHASEVYNHSKRPVPGENDVVEPIVLECDLLPRERPSSWPPWGGLAFAKNWKIPQCAEEVWAPSLCKEFLLVGTGGCRTASKLQPSATTESLRKCSRVRLCEPVTQCSLRSAMLARSH